MKTTEQTDDKFLEALVLEIFGSMAFQALFTTLLQQKEASTDRIGLDFQINDQIVTLTIAPAAKEKPNDE